MLRSLESANPAGERDEKLLGQVGNLAQDALEVLPVDHEHAQGGRGAHRDRARTAVEQAHLAEEIARPEEYPLLAWLLHRRRAVEDDEELVAGLAGPRARSARGHLDHT